MAAARSFQDVGIPISVLAAPEEQVVEHINDSEDADMFETVCGMNRLNNVRIKGRAGLW